MLRYQEDNQLHLDFHGLTDTTMKYIVSHYGEDALKEVLRRMGHDVYRSIREKLARGDSSELLEHLNWFFHREHGEYRLQVTDDEIRLEVTVCPAWRQMQKLGLTPSPYFCWQTREVNAGICSGTCWLSEVTGTGNGQCCQIFRRIR